MALGKLPVPGSPTYWSRVGQGLTVLAVGAGGGCLDIFSLVYHFSFLSPSPWETARYRLNYCLKGPLSPKQPTNQALNARDFYRLLCKNICSYCSSARPVVWPDSIIRCIPVNILPKWGPMKNRGKLNSPLTRSFHKTDMSWIDYRSLTKVGPSVNIDGPCKFYSKQKPRIFLSIVREKSCTYQSLQTAVIWMPKI